MPIARYDSLVSPAAQERWRRWSQDLIVAERKEREAEAARYGISPLSSESDHDPLRRRRRKDVGDTIRPSWLKRWSTMRSRSRHQPPMIEASFSTLLRHLEPALPSRSLKHISPTRLRPTSTKDTQTHMALPALLYGVRLILLQTVLKTSWRQASAKAREQTATETASTR
jgi:hypothetical protein